MNELELFEAIGGADEAYLTHSGRTVSRAHHAVVRAALVAAALTVALCATAAASAPVRQWLFGLLDVQTEKYSEPLTIVTDDMVYITGGRIAVTPEVKLCKDHPAVIESYCVPLYLENNWLPQESRVSTEYAALSAEEHDALHTEKGPALTYAPRGSAPEDVFFRQVRFTQYSGAYLDRGEPLLYLEVNPEKGYTQESFEVDGVQVGMIAVEYWRDPYRKNYGYRMYFWSDGTYVYSLQTPYRTDDRELLALVIGSLNPVEDVRPYERMRAVNYPGSAFHPLPETLEATWLPEHYEDFALPLTRQSFESGECIAGWWYNAETTDYFHTRETGEETYLVLTMSTAGSYLTYCRDRWTNGGLPHLQGYTFRGTTVRGHNAVAYESDRVLELVWQESEDYAVSLRSLGARKLTLDELIRVAEGLVHAPLPGGKGGASYER